VTLTEVLTELENDLPNHGFTNVRRGGTNVSGRNANSHGCVAFVGAWPDDSFAVIMAAGDDAKATRDKLEARLRSYNWL
jgi:hypothetical protein